MYTQAALLDIHERCHSTFAKLLEHCKTLTASELHQSMDGFGDATIQLQLHHLISAERYWTGVLYGRMDVEENAAEYPTVDSLEAYRAEVFELTATYIRSVTDAELNAKRTMTTWGDKEVELAPALVVLRPQMHIYHHQGQVLAMCRLLDKPGSGFDFPVR